MMPQRLPMIFILVTILIDAMRTGLIIPVMPDLIREVEGAGLAEAAIRAGSSRRPLRRCSFPAARRWAASRTGSGAGRGPWPRSA